MELKLSFDELSAYVQKHYAQTLVFSKAGDDTLCVAYSKKVLIKTIRIPLNLKFEKVTDTTVTVAYDGKVIGLDMIIGGALKAVKALMPELTEALSIGEGHRITIALTRIEKAQKLLETVALRGIAVLSDGILITAAIL